MNPHKLGVLTAIMLLTAFAYSQHWPSFSIEKNDKGKYALRDNNTGKIRYKNCYSIDSIHGFQFPIADETKKLLVIHTGNELKLFDRSTSKEWISLSCKPPFSIEEIPFEENSDPGLTSPVFMIKLVAENQDATIIFNSKLEMPIGIMPGNTDAHLIRNGTLIEVNSFLGDHFRRIINLNGKFIVPVIQQHDFYRFQKGFAYWDPLQSDYWGMVNFEGDTIVPFSYKKLQGSRDVNFILAVNDKKRTGVLNSDGKTLIPFEYAPIHPNFYPYFIYSDVGVFAFYKDSYKDSNLLLVDTTNTVLIPKGVLLDAAKFDYASKRPFFHLTNFIGYNGVYNASEKKMVIPMEFKIRKNNASAEYGLVEAINKEGKWGVLNMKDGSTIIPFEYIPKLTVFEQSTPDSIAVFILNKDGKYGLIDYTGKSLLPFEFDGFTSDFFKRYLLVERNGLYGVYSLKRESMMLPVEFTKISLEDYTVEKIEGGKIIYGRYDFKKKEVVWK